MSFDVAQPAQSDGLRLLAVHAHPDDESSKGAASMARYAAEGVQVMVATCTGGERGDILNAEAASDPQAHRDLAGIRRRDMAQAAAELGIQQRWLGFADSGLPEGDPLPPLPFGSFATLPLERAAAPLVKLVREFRPHVVISYDENGGYPHPDHIMCHQISVLAFDAAGDPERYLDSGEPWQPLKLYYNQTFTKARTIALHEGMLAAGLESPYGEWLERWEDHAERNITTHVPCAPWFEVRDRALLAHATQVDPDGAWFACPLEIQREVWPTEDFELARSLVDSDLPEDDLFAGIRSQVVPERSPA